MVTATDVRTIIRFDVLHLPLQYYEDTKVDIACGVVNITCIQDLFLLFNESGKISGECVVEGQGYTDCSLYIQRGADAFSVFPNRAARLQGEKFDIFNFKNSPILNSIWTTSDECATVSLDDPSQDLSGIVLIQSLCEGLYDCLP